MCDEMVEMRGNRRRTGVGGFTITIRECYNRTFTEIPYGEPPQDVFEKVLLRRLPSTGRAEHAQDNPLHATASHVPLQGHTAEGVRS